MINDHIQRGDYTYQIAPRLVFSAIRIADPLVGIFLLIYWADGFDNLSDIFGNAPIMLFFTCVFLAVLQQLYWAWVLSRERYTWFMALFPWNNALDWLWVYFLSQALNRGLPVNIWIFIGAPICIAGLMIELISNLQLHRFKSDQKNKGKLYTRGLFSVVIHPNYTGYILWRAALPLMTGYPLVAGIAFLFHLVQFNFHAHPPFQRYMASKYGQVWENYTAERKKFIPGII